MVRLHVLYSSHKLARVPVSHFHQAPTTLTSFCFDRQGFAPP
jgi:hypothetical protein